MEKIILDINKIKNNPKNPRIIKDDKFHKLVKSIKELPQMLDIRPIVVDENMIVLGGNMRLKACKEAGLQQVPVVIVNDFTEEQKEQFVIKDNANFGDWDWEVLQNSWDLELIADWGVDVFELPDEIDYSILENDGEDGENISHKLKSKQDGIKRALCIPFDKETYDQAAEIVKRAVKNEDINLGAILLEALKKIK